MRRAVPRRPYLYAIAATCIFALVLAALVGQIADGVRSVWPWTAARFPAPPFYYIAAAANVVAISGALVAVSSPITGGIIEIAAAFVGVIAALVVPQGLVPGYETLVVSQVLWCGLAVVAGMYLMAHGARTRPRTHAAARKAWV